MRWYSMTILVCLGLALWGCGSDGGGGGAGTGTPEESATTSVSSARDVGRLKADPQDEQALGALLQLQGAMQQLTAQGAPGGGTAGVPGQGRATGGLSADCVTTQGTKTTYENCGIQGATFSGSVDVDGDTVTYDFTMQLDSGSLMADAFAQADVPEGTPKPQIDEVTAHHTGTLVVTPSQIDGDVTVDITIKGSIDLSGVGERAGVPGLDTGNGPMPFDQTTSIQGTFDAVQLDEDGCPVGGTFTVHDATTGRTVKATYGPECGDVNVE